MGYLILIEPLCLYKHLLSLWVNNLIHFYKCCKKIVDAMKVFNEMPKRIVVSWNSTCHLHIIYHTFIIPRHHAIIPHASYTYHRVIILIMFIWLIISLKQAFKFIYVSPEFELYNTHNYSIVFKIILARCSSKLFNLSGSHSGSHYNTRHAKTHRP